MLLSSLPADVRRLVVDLPKEDHLRVKILALKLEVTMRDLIVEILWRHGMVETRPERLVLGEDDESWREVSLDQAA